MKRKKDNAWEDAQKLGRSKVGNADIIEVVIPGVIYLHKEGDNYLIYLHDDPDNIIKKSNMEEHEDGGGRSFIREYAREERPEISE